ncbi:heat shock factor protein-like isoform X2 [Dunckerocampus dactyliophorus]|uniref:heat shock factor protein-like isoform X2 n=1 Tax=Dunckerocampus dactyliophorus TaxID=161453 RepID=UPI002404EB70|nr:heat shock factor protein-like isoform X2 [Dunckerocampus dactyliophorus]
MFGSAHPMEYAKGAVEGSLLAATNVSNVPAFLTKLWTLLEDPETDPLICWSPTGNSFHVYDQARFSKEVLPQFFKHNNMASFIRQLNMYGFRKVVHIEQGGLLKPERDDTEFQHPFFIRGQEHLLDNIKRKVTNVSAVRQEEVKISANEVNKILNDVQVMKGKQETIDSRIIAMKHENEALWREMACLRQKHAQQQKVVNKLIQFLVSLVQSNRIMGVKRKLPLMLNDSSTTHSMPKYSRPFSLEHLQSAASIFPAESSLTSGPIISDVTELATPTAEEVVSNWMEAGKTNIKEEEPVIPDMVDSPVLEDAVTSVDTPLSPTAFINSILQENDTQSSQNTITPNLAPAAPVVLMSTPQTGPLPPAPNGQTSTPNPGSAQKCQTVVCIDKSELSDHVETIDNSLENLQNILNNQTFAFDTSPIMELMYPSWSSGDFDINILDSLLCDDTAKGADQSNSTGKQLVQYTPVQISEPVNVGEGGTDLPSLLELEAEPFLSPDTPTDDQTTKLNSDL